MTPTESNGRANQRLRTRKDLLAAAARLLKSGAPIDMDKVAEEAMVSRATAYRYFPSIDQLITEAPLDGLIPAPRDIFADDNSTDPAHRADKAEAALHDMCYRNEQALRALLAASLQRSADGATPRRQNRRTELIAEALAPARHRLTPDAYQRLTAALAMIFGLESMIVFTDVLGLDEHTARSVKQWAIRALVNAALTDPPHAPAP